MGALRCLGRLGIPTRVVSEDRFLYRASRWYHPAPPFAGGDLDEYLVSLSSGPKVLIPCSDRWVRAVADLPSELKEQFPSSVPPLPVLDQFLDKGLFSQLLQAEGVPHPRTLVPEEEGDFGQAEELEGFFLKPRDSQVFHQRFGVKAFWPDSEADLLHQLEFLRGEGFEMMVQEYVPGPASNHYFVDGFVDREGRVPAVFVRRRLRMYPPRFGNSSYMVSIPVTEAEPAAEIVTGLLGSLGYRGVFSAELKWDERDNLFKLLEVNARPWWFVEFAAVCGVNFLEMVYRDALGEPVDEVREYVVGKRLIHPYYDISACLRAYPSKMRGLLAFLRSIPGADRPIMRWNDPFPAFYEFAALTRSFVGRKLQGLDRR